MHRFHSKSTIIRFRVASLLLCSKYLLAPFACLCLIYAIFQNDSKLAQGAISIGITVALATVLQWILAAQARCPLCKTPALTNKDCAKHRRARTFMGSHRLRVALSILCTNTFHCPYCSEKSVMQVRDRQR